MCIIMYASGRQIFAVSYDIKFILKNGFGVIKNLVQSCAILSSTWSKNAPKRSGDASVNHLSMRLSQDTACINNRFYKNFNLSQSS